VDEGTAAFDDDGDGYSEEGGDCDDTNGWVFPQAVEDTCDDGQDNDCDTLIDVEDLDCGGQSVEGIDQGCQDCESSLGGGTGGGFALLLLAVLGWRRRR
jgi:MYXO-CTERM domain-containing protein